MEENTLFFLSAEKNNNDKMAAVTKGNHKKIHVRFREIVVRIFWQREYGTGPDNDSFGNNIVTLWQKSEYCIFIMT